MLAQISLTRVQSFHFGCSLRYSLKRRFGQNLLQVCRCGKQSLPFRQVAFGHKCSRSDIAARTDQIGDAWRPEGSGLGSLCGSRQRREAVSNHPADRERLRRLSLQVSTQNDSDDGATCG